MEPDRDLEPESPKAMRSDGKRWAELERDGKRWEEAERDGKR